MKWIGLTGGIGSGKSTVSELFRRRSVPVIDADAIAHFALSKESPVFSRVLNEFGDSIVDTNTGEVLRPELAKIIFKDLAAKAKLEGIIHPFVQSEVQRLKSEYARAQVPAVVYDVPLLFENGLESQFDSVIFVDCPMTLQIERVLKRSPHWTKDQVEERINNQLPSEYKKGRSQFVIDNSGTLQQLETDFERVCQLLKI